jgi:hypothetical protein
MREAHKFNFLFFLMETLKNYEKKKEKSKIIASRDDVKRTKIKS